MQQKIPGLKAKDEKQEKHQCRLIAKENPRPGGKKEKQQLYKYVFFSSQFLVA